MIAYVFIQFSKDTGRFVTIRVLSEQFPSFHKQFDFVLLGQVDGIDFEDASCKGKNIGNNIICLLTDEEKQDYMVSLRVLQPMFHEMVKQMNE